MAKRDAALVVVAVVSAKAITELFAVDVPHHVSHQQQLSF